MRCEGKYDMHELLGNWQRKGEDRYIVYMHFGIYTMYRLA
jgi:hypothetical protein